ncbi:MAG: GNAT family N-acetyltransferase [Proteobacteria bacterium]|nr:GNAT family N-acetyltransferase [Pseudomonadota bacterium]
MSHDSEILERAALASLHAAASDDLVSALGLRALTIGAGLVSVAAALPPTASVINRALGGGLSAPETEVTVKQTIAAYRDAGVARYFIQRHPQAEPAEMVGWLLDAGLVKTRGWQKFQRGREAPPQSPSDLRVEEIGPDQGAVFARILCAAFELGDLAEPWLARLPGHEGWRVFMCFDGDRPAGTATMYVADGLAWFDFAATAPEFRRRGSQGALLAARIETALAHGCRAMFACTGEDVPGDPQHSFKNILKAGFHETYVRENYAPPKLP